jgi:L-arabinose isomerase
VSQQTTISSKLRVGLFGIGLDAYWAQFPGLKARLEGYVERVGERLQGPEVELENLGLVDTAQASRGKQATGAGAPMWICW